MRKSSHVGEAEGGVGGGPNQMKMWSSPGCLWMGLFLLGFITLVTKGRGHFYLDSFIGGKWVATPIYFKLGHQKIRLTMS